MLSTWFSPHVASLRAYCINRSAMRCRAGKITGCFTSEVSRELVYLTHTRNKPSTSLWFNPFKLRSSILTLCHRVTQKLLDFTILIRLYSEYHSSAGLKASMRMLSNGRTPFITDSRPLSLVTQTITLSSWSMKGTCFARTERPKAKPQ